MKSPLLHSRRRVLTAIGGTLAAMQLGCGRHHGRDVDAGDALRVMGNPYNEATYRQLAKDFDRTEQGPHVQLSFSPRESDEIVRSLLLRRFSGLPLPDVAFLNGDLVRLFAERALLAPLDSLLTVDDRTSIRLARIGTAAHGAAFGVSVPVVAYNATLLRKAGFAGAPLPRDWEGVMEIARGIRVQSRDALGGFIEHDNGGAFTFLSLIQSFGLRAMSADERHVAFETEAGVRALDVLRQFGEVGQATADMSRRQARQAFAAGRIGLLVTMSSVVPHLRQASVGRFWPLVAPLPTAHAHAHATIPAAGPVAVLFATGADRAQRAMRFVRHAMQPRGQHILERTSGYLPANDATSAAAPSDRLKMFVDPARLTPWYTFPGRHALKIAELIQNELQQVATLQTSPSRALSSIVHSIESLLPGGT